MKTIYQGLLSVCLVLMSLCPMTAQVVGPSGTQGLLPAPESDSVSAAVDSLVQPMDSVAMAGSMAVADSVAVVQDSSIDLTVMHIYKREVVKQNCFFVVSKKECILSVYEVMGKDTVLAATFPVCYGRNPGNKTKSGDGCTPECSFKKPFYICQIQDAHTWRHDFKDGRGSILSYGKWFMRLDLSRSDCHPNVRSNRSIGIHGSTNNASSVPGRGSEGCVRLRDKDLIVLHDLYATIGTKVIILPAK